MDGRIRVQEALRDATLVALSELQLAHIHTPNLIASGSARGNAPRGGAGSRAVQGWRRRHDQVSAERTPPAALPGCEGRAASPIRTNSRKVDRPGEMRWRAAALS